MPPCKMPENQVAIPLLGISDTGNLLLFNVKSIKLSGVIYE